jgi:hypothetical protein
MGEELEEGAGADPAVVVAAVFGEGFIHGFCPALSLGSCRGKMAHGIFF